MTGIPYVEGMLGGIRWDAEDTTVIPALLEANARAILELARQQKIANRIALDQLYLGITGRFIEHQVGALQNSEHAESWPVVRDEIDEALR